MELKQFDYSKNPYTSSKIFDVHPLSRDGFTQYLSNDSYAHRYIKNKFDSKILEKIYGAESSKQNSQQNLYNLTNKIDSKYNIYDNQNNQNNQINKKDNEEPYEEKNNFILEKNENSELKTIESLKNNLLPNRKNTNFNNSNSNNDNKKINSNTEIIKEINFDKGTEIHADNNLNNLEDFRSQSKRNCYSSYNSISNRKTDMSKTNYSKNSGFNGNNNTNKNNLLKFLSIKKQLDKKHNPKDNIRWEKDYASNIEYLKKNQNLFFDIANEENNNNLRKKKYDGFESFNIPRLENIQADASKPAFQYTQRLVKSCIGRRKENSTNNNFLNNQNNLVNENTNKEEENNKQRVVEKIKEENEKLKNILNMQTNKDFLYRGNMPKISYVALQPKLVIKKFGLGGDGKFLGGNYNPDNFKTGRGNDINRRNYVGGLYSQ